MARSAIEWLWPKGYSGMAWNPITGCTKVSPGCLNCYAETLSIRFKDVHGYGGNYLAPSEDRAPILFHEDRLVQPFHWKKPRCVFVNSVSDLFHEEVEWLWIDWIINVIEQTPQHLYLVLTKRPEIMLEYTKARPKRFGDKPISNLWLGTSVENQHFANTRIPIIEKIPAAVRWLSVEPQVQRINWEGLIWRKDAQFGIDVTGLPGLHHKHGDVTNVDWIVHGGESGHGARPMHPAWPLDAYHAARDAGIPFFFKQWGQYRPHFMTDDMEPVIVPYAKGDAAYPGMPPDAAMVKVGKKEAGAKLYFAFNQNGGWGDARITEYPKGLVSA